VGVWECGSVGGGRWEVEDRSLLEVCRVDAWKPGCLLA
jgi:hypothetical protein